MMEEEMVAKNKVPQFDRAIKPFNESQPSDINAARKRDFNPVHGSPVRIVIYHPIHGFII